MFWVCKHFSWCTSNSVLCLWDSNHPQHLNFLLFWGSKPSWYLLQEILCHLFSHRCFSALTNIKFHLDGRCWGTRINGIYIKAALPADKLLHWPILMSVCCTETLKTAEIQPCYSFSPEALSSPSSTAHSWSPEAVKVSNILLALRIGNCFFHFWNAQVSIPLLLWDHLPGRVHVLLLFSTSVTGLPSFGFSYHLGHIGGLSTEKWNSVFLWFCPHPRGGDLLLLLEITAILGHLVNPPSWGGLKKFFRNSQNLLSNHF